MRLDKKKRKPRRKSHFAKLGFTNRLALYILMFLAAGLAGGFYLGILSIEAEYMGALACWTVVFTPIGTAVGIAIGKVVDKSKAENVAGNGDGIKFATAQAHGFVDDDEPPVADDSPAI